MIHDMESSLYYGSSQMDALTDMIGLLRPQSVLLGAMAASGRWGVRVPPQPGPTFYFVTQGHCWFQAGDGDPVQLHAGDYLLSARPLTDSFRSAPGAETALSDDAFKARHTIDGEIRLGAPGEEPATRILGGLILCDPANADLLTGLLPPIIHVPASEQSGARLGALIAIVRAEADDARPGRDAVLARLIEVMLIETLRREAASRLPPAGLLGGLADPQLARALADIHADVARGWTIDALARRAGMSRSVFARRFSEKVGAAPVEYLLGWRMALARDALRHGRGTLDEIAERIGYKSASAFSTAFRQRVGCPPGDYAARTRRGAGIAMASRDPGRETDTRV
jgi:AraC-like DNA-binding protein